jgi:hypothetical protein
MCVVHTYAATSRHGYPPTNATFSVHRFLRTNMYRSGVLPTPPTWGDRLHVGCIHALHSTYATCNLVPRIWDLRFLAQNPRNPEGPISCQEMLGISYQRSTRLRQERGRMRQRMGSMPARSSQSGPSDSAGRDMEWVRVAVRRCTSHPELCIWDVHVYATVVCMCGS